MGPPSNEHHCDWQEYARYQERRANDLAQENEQLKHELALHKKQRFGKRSEKAPARPTEPKPEQTPEQKAERQRKATERRQKNRASRAKLPEDGIKLTVRDEDKVCERCGQFAKFEEIPGGCKETEIIEAQINALRRKLYERQKLRCRCGQTFVEARPPERVFPECEFGPVFVSLVIVQKLLDSTPFYRQRKALDRQGLYVADNTLGQLFHKAAVKLEPIYKLLKDSVRKSWLVLADETTLTYLSPKEDPESKDGKKSQRGYVWCFLDPENDRVIFIYDRSRSSEIPKDLLEGTNGILLCDAYSGYNAVISSYDRERAGCLTHARRKFVELLESDGDTVAEILALFAVVYQVETEVAEAGQFGKDEHLKQRQGRSLPALEKIRALCEKSLDEGLEPTHPLAKALGYFQNQWPNLIKFTEDARIPVDNNYTERTLRIVALLRKNSLFVGSPESGQRTVELLSLAQSCVLSGANPLEYFSDVLMRMNDPPADLRELLPENWKPPQREKTALTAPQN